MTVPNEKTKKNHTGTGAVVAFAYDFLILDSDHMQVYLDDVLQSSGYSVSGIGDAGGGEVTFSVAPGDGVIVTLLRYVPYTQLVNYIDYDRFAADTHERALDLTVMACTQLQEQLDRSMVAALSADPDLSFLLPSRDAGKALMWDETEKKISNSTNNFNTLVTQCNAALALCQTAQAAAELAETNAESAETNAESAKTDSEAAQALAEAAQALAEAAQAAAEAAETSVYAFPSTANNWSAIQRYLATTANPAGSAVEIDFDSEPCQRWGLNGNLTVTFNNDDNFDASCVIEVFNNTGGPYTITWPANCKFMSGASDDGPAAGETKIFYLWSNGTNVFASVVWEGS